MILKSADPIAEVELKKLEERLRVAFRYDVFSTYDIQQVKFFLTNGMK